MTTLTDVERAIGLKVPPELDANTLSGLFMLRLARMPEVGDAIDEAGFRLVMQSLDDHRVGEIAIMTLADTDGS